jgi:hypothetical protein
MRPSALATVENAGIPEALPWYTNAAPSSFTTL